MKKIIAITMLWAGISHAQFKFSASEWDSKSGHFIKYDKIEHCIGSAVLYPSIRLWNVSPKKAVVYSIALGLAWEIKDAYVPYQKYGAWGGEGFCWKDLTADICGVLLSYGAEKLMRKIF